MEKYQFIASRILIYAFDSSRDSAMAETRKLLVDFFQKHLGFKEQSIVMVD